MKTVSLFRRALCFILTFLWLIPAVVNAQEIDRPKVGLVLSGGGAKGFAHVGVLKVLEKYNIPIDYIGGTSIGAIIGGMYAVGYNAQQIEDMILSQDWEALFSDQPERLYMPFYEKEGQDRYQISMHFKDGKLFIPNYAITNNGVIRLLSDLTLGYHDVDDFNDLPTPFMCIAVDLQTGKEVVINSGYLPTAMAASMAIPAVFPSVDTDSTIFVDGGVRNNFPVDHVREMGADIIIGVDVGAGMTKGEGLKTFGGIIDQLTTMLGSEKFKQNRKDCDLYIKPDISKFSTADFTHEAALGLLAEGEKVAYSQENEIAELAKLFDGYECPKREGYHGIDSAGMKVVENFDIQGSHLDDNAILGMMGISEETDMKTSVKDLKVGIDRLKASMQFSSINYKLKADTADEAYTLHLELDERANNTINFGAHYNTQDNVSLLFNGTFNTLFLRNSRISVDVKLSGVPVFDIRYNINRGSLPGLGLKYGLRRRVMENFVDGNAIGEATISKHYTELNTNSVVSDYFTIGLGARFEHFSVEDIKTPFPLTAGRYSYLLYRFFFKVDTKDKSYYPHRGLKFYSHTDLITDNGYELDGGIPSVITYMGMNKTVSFNHFYTLTPSLYAQLEYNSSATTPLFYDTYVGGYNQPNDIVSQIPFWGLRWGEYKASNVVTLGVENRFQVAKKNYVFVNANMMANTSVLKGASLDDVTYKVGFALGYSYNSLLGPMELYFSMSNDKKLRSFVSIGYYF